MTKNSKVPLTEFLKDFLDFFLPTVPIILIVLAIYWAALKLIVKFILG